MTEEDIDPDGPLAIHEALHTAYVLWDTWCTHVIEHPALSNKPDIMALADRASEAMGDVYQALGAVRKGEQDKMLMEIERLRAAVHARPVDKAD